MKEQRFLRLRGLFNFECEILNGCVNRICVTEDVVEFTSLAENLFKIVGRVYRLSPHCHGYVKE